MNRYSLQRGKGHALTHEYHHAASELRGARRFIPAFSTGALVAAINAFMLGGLLCRWLTSWLRPRPLSNTCSDSRRHQRQTPRVWIVRPGVKRTSGPVGDHRLAAAEVPDKLSCTDIRRLVAARKSGEEQRPQAPRRCFMLLNRLLPG